MSYDLQISQELDEERKERPPEVRRALAAVIRQLADQHANRKPEYGQMQFSLRDENDFNFEYFRPDVDWIPGHLLYRWNQSALVVGYIQWPEKYPWVMP